MPGYRELIRARVSAAARERGRRTTLVESRQGFGGPGELRRAGGVDERAVERGLRELLSGDVDRLGREVEGCG